MVVCFSTLWPNNIPLPYIYIFITFLLIHVSVDRYLGCPLRMLLAITNAAAVNINVHFCDAVVQTYVFISLDYIPNSKMTGFQPYPDPLTTRKVKS